MNNKTILVYHNDRPVGLAMGTGIAYLDDYTEYQGKREDLTSAPGYPVHSSSPERMESPASEQLDSIVIEFPASVAPDAMHTWRDIFRAGQQMMLRGTVGILVEMPDQRAADRISPVILAMCEAVFAGGAVPRRES